MLEAVRALDLASIDGRRAVYDGIETVVRRHLQDVCGIDTVGLTSAELAEALSGRRSGLSADAVRALVAESERARYAPLHLVPAGEACRTAIDQASQLVSQR